MGEITSTPLLTTSEDNTTPVATPLSVASKRMGDVSVKSSPSTPGLVTDAMLAEENMYKEERKEEEDRDDVRAQALEELNRTGKQERFDRLQNLLNRSEAYSSYLLGRVNKRREEEEEKAAAK